MPRAALLRQPWSHGADAFGRPACHKSSADVQAWRRTGRPTHPSSAKRARRKAAAVAARHPGRWVVAADQVGVVVRDGTTTMLTKQDDEEGAVQQLLTMSGTTHELVNGLVVLAVDSGRTVEGVDRQLVTMRPVTEAEARAYAKANDLPIIGCCCPACGDLSLQRQRVKRLIMELEREHPNVKGSMIKALANVMPRHLLDRRLNPTADLRAAAATALDDFADVAADVPLIPLMLGPSAATSRNVPSKKIQDPS